MLEHLRRYFAAYRKADLCNRPVLAVSDPTSAGHSSRRRSPSAAAAKACHEGLSNSRRRQDPAPSAGASALQPAPRARRCRSGACRATLGGLEQAIDDLEETIGLTCLRPGHDPFHMAAHEAGNFLHRFDLGPHHAHAPVICALGSSLVTPLMKAGDMSMLTEVICSGGQPGDRPPAPRWSWHRAPPGDKDHSARLGVDGQGHVADVAIADLHAPIG